MQKGLRTLDPRAGLLGFRLKAWLDHFRSLCTKITGSTSSDQSDRLSACVAFSSEVRLFYTGLCSPGDVDNLFLKQAVGGSELITACNAVDVQQLVRTFADTCAFINERT